MTSPHAIMGRTHRWQAGGPADCWAKNRRVNTLGRGQKGGFQNPWVILAHRCLTIGEGWRRNTAKGTAWAPLEPELAPEALETERASRVQIQMLPEPPATHQARECWALPDLCNFCQESNHCL